MHSYGESRIPEVAGGVTMEGDILAYLNQKEFPTCTYPRSSWALPSFRLLSVSRGARLSVCLCSSLVRLLADATCSIADVENVIDVLSA